MNERQSRLMVVLATVLVGLVALVVLVEPPEKKDEEEGGRHWSEAFPEIEAASLTRLSITGGGATIRVEKTDDGWRILEPIQVPAEGEAVERILDSLAEAELSEPLERQDPAPFGLDEPQAEVLASTADGKELRLEIGADAPAGAGSYVRDGQGQIRVSRTRLSALLPDLDALRSKEILRFPTSAVTGLRIERPENPLLFQKVEDGWWLGEDAGRVRADESRVQDLLATIGSLEVERFPSAPLPPPDGTRITVTTPEGSHLLQLAQGSDPVRVVTGPLLSMPAEADLSGLDTLLTGAPEVWRSSRLLPVQPLRVEALSVQLGEQKLEASRGGSGWEPASAEPVLAAILDARADRVQPLAATPEGEPWGRLRLTESGGRVSEVLLHQPIEGGRLAIEPAGGAPFRVPDSEISRLLDALKGGG